MMPLSSTAIKLMSSVDKVHGRLKEKPRRGRPVVYSTTVIIRCYLLMLIWPPLREHAALHAFLSQHEMVRRLIGLEQMPHRTTLSRRFKGLEQGLKGRIWAMGWAFILAGYVQVHILMADGSLHQASGPSWASKYKKQGVMPETLRHVDRGAGWGKSSYHGWVWGYRSHPVVALTADLQPIPILADAQPADVQENNILASQLPWLPPDATVLVVDSNYEDIALWQTWTEQDENGLYSRWFLADPKERPGQPSPWRQQLQLWRHLEELDLYKLRGQLVEPFFAHWKDAFDLKVVPLQGKDAPIYLLLALYAYQLLLWDNLKSGRPLYAYKHLTLG